MTQMYSQRDLPMTLEPEYMTLSHDGRVLVTADASSVRVWDMLALEQTRVLSASDMYLNDVSVSPGGTIVAAADTEENRVLLWDTRTGRLRGTLRGHTDMPLSVTFTPDGQTLVTSGRDATVRLWDVANGRQRALLNGHTGPVAKVAVSPDGCVAASVSVDHTLRLWSLPDGQALWHRSVSPISPTRVAFSTDGSRVAIAGDTFTYPENEGYAEVQVFSTTSGEPQGLPFVSASRVWALTFTEAELLVFGDWEGQLTLLHASTGREMGQHTLEGPYGPSRVSALAWNASTNVLVVGHADGVALLEPPDSVQPVHTRATAESTLFMQHHTQVRSLAVGQDGNLLAIGAWDGYVGVWSTRRTEPLREYQAQEGVHKVALDEARGQVFAAVWSITPAQNRLRRWNLLDDAPPIDLGGFPERLLSLSLSGDGRWLAVGILGTGVQLRARSGALPLVHTIKLSANAEHVAFSPDGTHLAIVTDVSEPQVLVYAVESQRMVRIWSMGSLPGVQSWFNGMHWLDAQRLVTGEGAGTVRVLNVVTGDEETRFEGHSDAVHAVTALGDRNQVFSGSSDGTVRQWDVSSGTEQARWPMAELVLAMAAHPSAGVYVAEQSGRVSWLRSGQEPHSADRGGLLVEGL